MNKSLYLRHIGIYSKTACFEIHNFNEKYEKSTNKQNIYYTESRDYETSKTKKVSIS